MHFLKLDINCPWLFKEVKQFNLQLKETYDTFARAAASEWVGKITITMTLDEDNIPHGTWEGAGE